MKNEYTKGCFGLIVIFILIFIILSIFMSVMDFIGVILSYPIVYYGIPVVLFVFLYYSNKKRNDENKNNKDKS